MLLRGMRSASIEMHLIFRGAPRPLGEIPTLLFTLLNDACEFPEEAGNINVSDTCKEKNTGLGFFLMWSSFRSRPPGKSMQRTVGERVWSVCVFLLYTRHAGECIVAGCRCQCIQHRGASGLLKAAQGLSLSGFVVQLARYYTWTLARM